MKLIQFIYNDNIIAQQSADMHLNRVDEIDHMYLSFIYINFPYLYFIYSLITQVDCLLKAHVTQGILAHNIAIKR